jgi:hypothetical protein
MKPEIILLKTLDKVFERDDIKYSYSRMKVVVSDRTITSYLNKLLDQQLIIKIKKGVYMKTYC